MPLAMAQDNSSLEIVNNNVTACETYTWNVNGVTYTSSTVTTYLNATNDTLFVLNLTVNHPFYNAEPITSNNCSYTWRGTITTTLAPIPTP